MIEQCRVPMYYSHYYITDQPINEENYPDISEDEHFSEDVELIIPVNKVDVSTQYGSSKQLAPSVEILLKQMLVLSVVILSKQMLAPSVEVGLKQMLAPSVEIVLEQMLAPSVEIVLEQKLAPSVKEPAQPIVEMKSEAIQIERPDIIHEVVQTDELEEENEVTVVVVSYDVIVCIRTHLMHELQLSHHTIDYCCTL